MTGILRNISAIHNSNRTQNRSELLTKLAYAMYLFTFGSVAGWCLEVVFRSVTHGRLYIPGFLMGPYCPIYGMGMLLIVFVCNHKSKIRSFFEIVFLSSALEYVISFLAENMFGKLLWDYSDLPLSIGTRVSFAFSIAWGALGLLVLVFAEPALHRIYTSHKKATQDISAGILSAIVLDFILSAAMCL